MSGLIDTGYKPRWFQREIHQRLKRFSVLVLHRRAGKTVLAVNQLIHSCLTAKRNDARFGYIAPYLKQSKSIAWDYVKLYTRAVPGMRYNESELAADFPNGSRLRLFGADNPDTMRGLYFDGVVPDEVADMRPETWGEVIRPALADRKGWCLFIGTPKGMNLFYDLYQQGQTDPAWYSAIYRADETGAIDAEELDLARRAMSDAQFRQEFLCDFAAATDNTLITIDVVAAAVKRVVTERDLAGLPRILGVDVARFGDDRSVIQKRQGFAAFPPQVIKGADNMHLVGLVAQEAVAWKANAIFIDAGRGEGVIDRLRQLGFQVVEVNFGAKATQPRFVNKRAEMWSDMATWLAVGGAIPNEPELKTDLCVPTYSYDAANRFKLESKDEIKARGLRSPDLGDALALTFAYPVAMTDVYLPSEAGRRQPAMATHDYNPFEVA